MPSRNLSIDVSMLESTLPLLIVKFLAANKPKSIMRQTNLTDVLDRAHPDKKSASTLRRSILLEFKLLLLIIIWRVVPQIILLDDSRRLGLPSCTGARNASGRYNRVFYLD